MSSPSSGMDQGAEFVQVACGMIGREPPDAKGHASSLKFCRLAERQADLYPRFGRTMARDIRAPQIAVGAAGGCVLTMEGQPLGYGKPGQENPWFVCWGARLG